MLGLRAIAWVMVVVLVVVGVVVVVVTLIIGLILVVALVNAVLNSNSPISQNMYGVFGRNTGFLTYLFLLIILIGIACISDLASLRKLIYGFIFSGIVNVAYCLWVLSFGDFIPWNNPYGAILGLFGNPNFISSFLGMLISVFCAYILSMNSSLKLRLLFLGLSVVAFFEIVQSRSIQGIAVTFFGCSLVVFLFLVYI